MGAANELQRLCEAWWEEIAHSTKHEHHRFAENFLELLGWHEPAPIAVQALAPQLSAVSYILRGPGQTNVAAHFGIPGSLEPPSSVVERGLDFCEATRTLVEVSRSLHVPYCFVTDLFRSYLYDVRTDELLLYADSPGEFKKEMGMVIERGQIECGSLEELRRQPRTHVARQLREWRRRWSDTLAAFTEQPEEAVEIVLDRLVVLRFLLDHDIHKRSAWSLRTRYDEALAAAREPEPFGCAQALLRLFRDMSSEWRASLFAPVTGLDEAIAQDELIAPLLVEFALLSRTKFALPTILESFNYGDASEKARIRLIPEDDEERLALLLKQTATTVDELEIEVDIEDEGYRAVTHWLDRLAQVYQRLAAEYESTEEVQAPADYDMDLLEWSERAALSPSAFTDPYHHALEQALTIHYASPRQRRTARLLVYLHVIARYAQRPDRFTRFPHIEAALKPRPPRTPQVHRRG
jgi:hypothetical protein